MFNAAKVFPLIGRKKSVRASAKINPFLEVLGKRPDGYHEIRTLMIPVSLYDDLTIETTGEGEVIIECDHPSLRGRPNLAAKAAEHFLRRVDSNLGVRIRLVKRIPVAAGLGGGSSDAAAVLSGLNTLLDRMLTERELAESALELGADVPFFLRSEPCLAQGIGEKLTPVRLEVKCWFLLVNPGIEVSTAEVYGNLNLELTKKHLDTILPTNIKGPSQIVKLLRNDLEGAAQGLCPKIGEIKKFFRSLGVNETLLSGSGPTVFSPVIDRTEGKKLLRAIQRETDWSCYLVSST